MKDSRPTAACRRRRSRRWRWVLEEDDADGSGGQQSRVLSATSSNACRNTESRSSPRRAGLACHVNAREFLPHVPPLQYPAESLNAALYLVSGARGVERGTMSEDRDRSGKEVTARMELVRIAIPRRTYTLGHIEYVADRVAWLHRHRDLIGGLRFVRGPPVMRFFFGRLEPLGDWGAEVVKAFQSDYGDAL